MPRYLCVFLLLQCQRPIIRLSLCFRVSLQGSIITISLTRVRLIQQLFPYLPFCARHEKKLAKELVFTKHLFVASDLFSVFLFFLIVETKFAKISYAGNKVL